MAAAWFPFAPSSPGFEPQWWDDPGLYGDGSICFDVRLGGVEVARVRLEETLDISAYTAAPHLGDAILQVDFFEVAERRRGEGIGRELVDRLATLYPDRRLVAISLNLRADEFWGRRSVGTGTSTLGVSTTGARSTSSRPDVTGPAPGRRGWRRGVRG